VCVVQLGSIIGIGSHFVSGAQAGVEVALHTVLVDSKHTMPEAQSASTAHAPGTHSRISIGSHGGCGGQG